MNQDRVFGKLTSLTFDQAAAMPTVFLTAWFMVHELANVHAGERWLVHSAAGGVGTALAQLGRLADCKVTGVVGHADKIGTARAAGCTHVIDKQNDDLWQGAELISSDGFDAVFDANGISTLGQSYRHVAPTGRLCIFGFASMLPKGRGMEWLLARFASGKLSAPPITAYALADAAWAQAALESRRSVGKLILRP